MKNRKLIKALSLLAVTLIITACFSTMNTVAGDTAGVVTFATPSGINPFDTYGIGGDLVADAYYTTNETTEGFSRIASFFGFAKSDIQALESVYLGYGGVSVIDLTTTEVSTHYFYFLTEFDPYWVKGEILAGALLGTFSDSQINQYLKGTDSIGIAMAFKEDYNIRAKAFNEIPSLGKMFASEPSLNGTTLTIGVNSALYDASTSVVTSQDSLEDSMDAHLDDVIADNEGWESHANMSTASYNHTWIETAGTDVFYDNDNVTTGLEIQHTGIADWGDIVQETMRNQYSSLGALELWDDSAEDNILEVFPDESQDKAIGLFFVSNPFFEFINRVRPILDIPRQIAANAQAAVFRFTNRAQVVAGTDKTHTIQTTEAKLTNPIQALARTAVGFVANIGDKVRAFGSGILGFVPRLMSMGIFIVIAIVLLLGLLVLVMWFRSRGKKRRGRKGY